MEVLRRHFPGVDSTGTFTIDDFVHACGQASQALLYATVFCPQLVEVDGSVLLLSAVESDADRRRFLDFKASRGRRTAECSFNLIEVPYLFAPPDEELPAGDDDILADVIAASWRAWLGAKYQGRQFVVDLIDPRETGSVVGIHFYEVRGDKP